MCSSMTKPRYPSFSVWELPRPCLNPCQDLWVQSRGPEWQVLPLEISIGSTLTGKSEAEQKGSGLGCVNGGQPMVHCLERSHSTLPTVPLTLRPGTAPCPLPSFLPSAPSSYSWYYPPDAGMALPTSFLTPEISYATRSILYI